MQKRFRLRHLPTHRSLLHNATRCHHCHPPKRDPLPPDSINPLARRPLVAHISVSLGHTHIQMRSPNSSPPEVSLRYLCIFNGPAWPKSTMQDVSKKVQRVEKSTTKAGMP